MASALSQALPSQALTGPPPRIIALCSGRIPHAQSRDQHCYTHQAQAPGNQRRTPPLIRPIGNHVLHRDHPRPLGTSRSPRSSSASRQGCLKRAPAPAPSAVQAPALVQSRLPRSSRAGVRAHPAPAATSRRPRSSSASHQGSLKRAPAPAPSAVPASEPPASVVACRPTIFRNL